MKRKLLALLLALVLVLALLPVSVGAANSGKLSDYFLGGKITAPKTPYVVYEYDVDHGDFLYLWYNNSPDVLAFTKAYNLATEAGIESDVACQDLFGISDFRLLVETDCRIDGGAWHYTKDWDDPEASIDSLENMPYYLVYCAQEYLDGGKAYANTTLSWLIYIDSEDAAGFLLPYLYTKDNEDGESMYHYDMANHTFGFRCRTKLLYEIGGETKVLISDWSPETSIGKNGNQRKLTAPTSIPAPTIDTFELRVDVNDAGEQTNSVWYYLNIPESVYDGILYCNAQQGMYESYCIESQLRVNGGDWLDAYTANPDWIFSDTRATYVPGYDLKETDLVELRVRLTCEPLGLVSPWSNVLGSKPTFQAHAWATAELEEAYALGLIPDSLKDADLTKPITRAEFAAVSVKVYEALTGVKAEPVAQNPFTDCSDPEVLKALNVGITNGTNKEGTTFSPNVLLNREQAATMLARVYKKVVFDGWTLETDSAYNDQFRALFTMPDLFPDDAKISGWAKDSVYFMAANGIINGKADKNDGGVLKFFPKDVTDAEKALGYAQATREAALLIAVRMVKNLGE